MRHVLSTAAYFAACQKDNVRSVFRSNLKLSFYGMTHWCMKFRASHYSENVPIVHTRSICTRNELLCSFIKGELGGACGRHFGLSLHYSVRAFLWGEALTRNYLVARQQTSSCLTLQEKVQHPFIPKAWALLSQYYTLLMTWFMRWRGEGAKENWGGRGKDGEWKFNLDQFIPAVFICVG